MSSTTTQNHPESVRIHAIDGYSLGAVVRRHPGSSSLPRPVVIINPATSVRSLYYARFANYLHAHGSDVLTYDYRGIGESAHGSLRRFRADWLDWGASDFEGVLQYAAAHFPGQPIDVVGHSIGGFLIGLAPSAHLVRRIFTMGAQYAYWRDYLPNERKRMLLRWDVVMPLLAYVYGYVPGKRLGWMEDTPKEVALDWARMGPRFELSLRRRRKLPDDVTDRMTLAHRFGRIRAPILALGIEDDPFGTVPAIDRLLGYYMQSERHHLRLTPAAIGQDAIGHFAFFHQRFRESLWPIALDWLHNQTLPSPLPGSMRHRFPEGQAENPATQPAEEKQHERSIHAPST
ncbi:alpha/beta fold hydrolase [Rhodanobacter sp. C03]|uniref:alpha/beta hydrolase family protein n=1 Tax=Rhodanobacter sp. C03 TaxID=1945858 RepID=UPI00098558BC|nr:alpha/beta fold hydrolase [Rhodanobacter sp. C03]OOG56216.1 alpha/beta hydrolase [Rhodanobacter sp. C03]